MLERRGAMRRDTNNERRPILSSNLKKLLKILCAFCRVLSVMVYEGDSEGLAALGLTRERKVLQADTRYFDIPANSLCARTVYIYPVIRCISAYRQIDP